MSYSDWEIAKEDIHLGNDEIHVWLCELKTSTSELYKAEKILSNDELNKAGKFHFEKDSVAYKLSHIKLRIILSKYLYLKPKQINFKHNNFGKPFLNENNNMEFNLSHSGEYCLVAVTKNNIVGVDIEKINKKFSTMEIAGKYFSANEYNEIKKLEKEKQTKAFYHCWTRKEAFIKAVGKGLSIPLNSFDVTVTKNNPQIYRINDNKNISDWHLYNLPVGDNYCGTVAYKGKTKKIKLYKVI